MKKKATIEDVHADYFIAKKEGDGPDMEFNALRGLRAYARGVSIGLRPDMIETYISWGISAYLGMPKMGEDKSRHPQYSSEGAARLQKLAALLTDEGRSIWGHVREKRKEERRQKLEFEKSREKSQSLGVSSKKASSGSPLSKVRKKRSS